MNNGNYTFRITTSFRPTGGSTETTTSGENGTYVIDGETITFTSTHAFVDGELIEFPGSVTVGTKVGDTITGDLELDDGTTATLVFNKR